MTYDVEIARAVGGDVGWGTDSTTSNKRWAQDRERQLEQRGAVARVVDRNGRILPPLERVSL